MTFTTIFVKKKTRSTGTISFSFLLKEVNARKVLGIHTHQYIVKLRACAATLLSQRRKGAVEGGEGTKFKQNCEDKGKKYEYGTNLFIVAFRAHYCIEKNTEHS